MSHNDRSGTHGIDEETTTHDHGEKRFRTQQQRTEIALAVKRQRGKQGMRWIGSLGVFLSFLSRINSLAMPRHGQGPRSDDSGVGRSRRRFLRTIGYATPFASLVQESGAAAPVTKEETESTTAKLFRAARPKPTRALRNKLSLDFAVLLMRSSYNALDELDCVPMDQFQRDFFLVRQGESARASGRRHSHDTLMIP